MASLIGTPMTSFITFPAFLYFSMFSDEALQRNDSRAKVVAVLYSTSRVSERCNSCFRYGHKVPLVDADKVSDEADVIVRKLRASLHDPGFPHRPEMEPTVEMTCGLVLQYPEFNI